MARGGKYLRTSEAAELLGVDSPQTVVNYVKNDWLRDQPTPGGHHRIERDSVEELRAALKIKDPAVRRAAVEALARHNRGEGPPTVDGGSF